MDATPRNSEIRSLSGAGQPAATAERRGEQRSMISLMRAAKLVCQSGEYVCLIRDVSAGGVRVSLFHALPAESHVFIELANGEVHAMIRVWERGTTAGFRFAKAVDPSDFLAQTGAPEDRQLRIRLRTPGMVMANGLVQPVLLRDLSQTGAQLEADGYLALGQTLILSVDGLGEFGGWVRWRRGRSYGVVFEMVHRLDQLAAQALVLQPLAAPPPAEVEIFRGVA